MEVSKIHDNKSADVAADGMTSVVKHSLSRSIMLLFSFIVYSFMFAVADDYMIVGSIGELRAKCETGEIKHQDKIFIDIDFTVQQKYLASRYFVNDIDRPQEFIVLANFSSKLYENEASLNKFIFHGLFGQLSLSDQFTLFGCAVPDDLSDKVHQPIDGEPEFCLPIIAGAAFFSNTDNFGKVFKLDGNFTTISKSELTIDGKKIKISGAISSIDNSSRLIGGFYDIYDGTPEVYITEVWNVGSEPMRTLKAIGGFGGLATIGSSANEVDKEAVEVKDGDKVWLKAIPDRGYVFENWSVCGEVVSTESECCVTAISNSTYRANFRAVGTLAVFEFSVTSNDESLGSVEIEIDHSIIEGNRFEAESGSEVTLRATTVGKAGFDGWYVDDVKLSDKELYSFTVSDELSIEARFFQRYSIAIAANELGTVEVTAGGEKISDGELVAAGTTVKVIAQPNSDMELETLTINGKDYSSPFILTVDSDISISVIFTDPTAVKDEPATSLADLRESHPDGRKIMITTPLTVVMGYTGNWLITDGNAVAIAALPHGAGATNGVVFSELEAECKTYDGVFYLINVKVIKDETSAPLSINPQVVSVDKLPEMAGQYVTISNAELVGADMNNYVISDNSRINGSSAKFPVYIHSEESSKLSAFYNTLSREPIYTLTGFVGSLAGEMGLIVTSLPEASDNTNMMKISVFVDDVSHGRSWLTVEEDEVASTTADVVNGSNVSLHAEAAEGYEFIGWRFFGDESGTENPMTVKVTMPSTYTAMFRHMATEPAETPNEPIAPGEDDDDNNDVTNGYAVTVNQSAHGTIRAYFGETEIDAAATYPEGTEITIIATADDGYHLQQVLVDNNPMETSVDGKLTIRLAANVIVTAIFERNMPVYASLSVAAAEWLEGESMGVVYIDNPGTTSLTATRGESHAFHAEPAEGCRFVGWRVQGGNAIQNTSAVFNLVAAENIMLVAEFDYVITKPRRVTVRPSRADKGTVKISGTRLTELTTRRYLHISAESAGPDHEFSGWVNGEGKLISSQSSIIYSDDSSIELIANFSSAYFVTLSAEGAGTISCSAMDLSERVAEGSVVRVLIVPDINYELAEVTIDGNPVVSKESNDGYYYVDLTVDAHHSVKATFELRKFTLMYSSHTHGELSVYSSINADGLPDGSKITSGLQMPYDTPLHVYVTPDDDYKIETLTVNGEAMAIDKLKRLNETVYFNLPMRSDIAIVATYVYDGHTTTIVVPDADAVSPDASVYDLSGRKRGTVATFSSLPPGIYLVPSSYGCYKKIFKR